MNDVSLRVSALKLCAHPKRFSEMRNALVPLPLKWQNSTIDYVEEFAQATNCAKQLSIVKDAFENPRSFPFLADILFVCPLKHPVRGVVTRLFSNAECSKRSPITHSRERILSALRGALREVSVNINSSCAFADDMNDLFVSVSGCLQSFPFGRDALALEIYCFIPLVPKAMALFWGLLSDTGTQISPTRRNECYLYLQNLLRFHVNFMTEFKSELMPERCRPLKSIDAIAEQASRSVDTPWDVRAVAGLAIGHNARLFGDFANYLLKCQSLNEFNDLPMKAASLLMLQKSDYGTCAAQALDILKRTLEHVDSASNVSNFLVYLSKHLNTYSKSLGGIKLTDRPQIMYSLILAMLMRFALQHISSNIETIRHMCASLLHQVLQHSKAAGQTNVIAQVYAQYERQRMPLPSVCLMLQQVVEVLGVQAVMMNCPGIFDKMFPVHLGREDSVNALFKSMMTVAHNEETSKEWRRLWCSLLYRAAVPCDDRLVCIERLIKVAVHLDDEVLPELMKQRHLSISTKLAAMLTARRHGQQRMVKALMADHLDQLNAALVGVDDNSRLLALSFVVDTPRLSESYTQFELDSIITYIELNANNPNAHMRQIGHGLLQKAVKRLEYNLAQQLKDKPLAVNEDNMLIIFVNKLVHLLAMNLFPTANYGRRWLSLRVLDDCIEMMERLNLPWRQRMPPQSWPYLDYCLRDSYEHNKVQAALLLAKLQTCCPYDPMDILEQLKSVRVTDSSTAVYRLQVYCKAAEVALAPPLNDDAVLPKHHARDYAILRMCMDHLREGAAAAESDLTEAAQTNPLYGLLFASRHLLLQLELKPLAEDQLWFEYIEDLLNICVTITNIMLPIVGSDSPEGMVPGSQKPTAKPISDPDTQAELDTLSLLPQMVLLSAWRSIKEIALIMGDLVQRAPLQQERKHNYLLSQEQVALIGEQFILLLADVKHRGAFEQAYVGFTWLCRRFWHSDEPALSQLPPKWMEEAMRLVTGMGDKELCSTRRSAGMPYMLQALICTELKLGTHNTFKRSMSLLLEVCERRELGADAAIARSHAMNIMRALFRCSELADVVGDFVGRGIECALESVMAEEWNERNSATLMLSALMVRVFGVERARSDSGELHVRNRMTGRIFFTRYPKLFDYFHANLKKAAERCRASPKGGQTVQLEAMLQLLYRLYPSSMEGTESSLNLSVFVPFLEAITCVNDSTTRYRSCEVLANFGNTTLAFESIRRISAMFSVINFKHKRGEPLPKNINLLHGKVLQLKELYRVARWQDVRLTCTMMYMMSVIAVKMLSHDMFIFRTIVMVLTDALADLQECKHIGAAVLNALLAIYELNHLAIYRHCEEYTVSPKFFAIFALHLHRLTLQPDGLLEHMFEMLVRPDNVPSKLEHVKIDLWLYTLIHQAASGTKARGLIEPFELKHFDFDPDVVTYYKTLSRSQRSNLATQLRQSKAVRLHAMKMAGIIDRSAHWAPGLSCRVFAFLALLNDIDLSMLQLLNRGGFDAEPGVTICLTRLIMDNGMLSSYQYYWVPLIRYTVHNSSPKRPVYMRYRSAQLLDRMTVHVQQIIHSDDAFMIGNYIRLVLQLLVDESEMVRNYTSELVSSCMGLYLGGERALESVLEVSMLPIEAEKFFLEHMLEALQRYKTNGNFLIACFNLVVEPFVSVELLFNRTIEEAPSKFFSGDDEAEGEIFDKQEVNQYCEGLRIASVVAKSFNVAFPNNEELMKALDAVEKLCSYKGFTAEPIPPRIIA
ncbi:PREDICTED: thyroid adenoma-associated protein homolog [Drosophila arizonae]|uniref:tRNA (32-2'-O)-methyltransferase regulator THADA n=1 Tax=Drosophila arizonae TaxID=7263 RepID=A0ABM1PRI5_DROAR|nr:PREDICTED: thyroid adenoma-associated protein homolog [Drosophila arizonae]XP_017869821.1 PREDICTED: thyroid adenoma-associated protein homolog [Drosophila arizonae]